MRPSANMSEQVQGTEPATLTLWADIWLTPSKTFVNSEMEMQNKEVEKCIWISLHFFKAQIIISICLFKLYDIIIQHNDCLDKEALHLLEQAYSLFKHDILWKFIY